MIKLKDHRSSIYSAFMHCEEESCKKESTRIWASSQTRIVDLCDDHYKFVTEGRDYGLE
jgi:hypothetical protein